MSGLQHCLVSGCKGVAVIGTVLCGPCSEPRPWAPLKEVPVPSAQIVDAVINPSHYNKVPGVECIQVTQHFNFNVGNAIKYLWRANHKGSYEQDLLKAKQYIDFELARVRGGK